MPKASPSTTQDRTTSPMPASYEAAMEELERLAGELESGAMPLDAVLGGYRRGAELLQFCRGKLESVEEQIKLLEAGMVKPWTPE
ncbi:MAG: exodeoxyribonuclease VII small subunit [Burkholderiaceae bacterium]